MAVSQGASPDKIPPQNIEAECSVLGAMMIDKEAIGKVIEILDESCFYKESHRKIFSVIINLFEKNEAVDFITITDELRKKNWFDEVGGAVYITNLIDSLPTSANVEYYARIVKEKAIIRSMISVSTQIISSAYGEVEDMDVLVDKWESEGLNEATIVDRFEALGFKRKMIEYFYSTLYR